MEKKGARVVGISTDSVEAQRKFKEELKVPFPLLSDPGGHVARQYGGTIPVVGLAHRATFVVGEDGIVQRVVTGSDAIDPAGAVESCPAHRPRG